MPYKDPEMKRLWSRLYGQPIKSRHLDRGHPAPTRGTPGVTKRRWTEEECRAVCGPGRTKTLIELSLELRRTLGAIASHRHICTRYPKA